jgi:hypothetical protein
MDYNTKVNLTRECNHATLGMSEKGNTIVKRKIFSKLWHCYNEYNTGNKVQEYNLKQVFTNHSKEEEIFPFTTQEIAEAQKDNNKLKHCFKRNAVLNKGMEVSFIDNAYMVCKDGRMIIPKSLRRRPVLWFHRYLQHPGHTRLEETMNATIYWKGMCTSIRSITKSCKACQVNKKQRLKNGQILPKTVTTVPWRVLCVDLTGPYTLKGKDCLVIEVMALTMINPTTSWFKIVELPSIR